MINVHCLYDLLARDLLEGSFVKSLNVVPLPEDVSPENYASFEELWGQLEITVGREATQKEAEGFFLGFILEKCRNLQTLNLSGSIFRFPLTDQTGIPFDFLTHSLKRLFLRGCEDPKI